MRHYERALELAPRHFQAMFNLGRLYGARGDRVRQEELWRAAIAAHPDFARGYLLLAKLLMDPERRPRRGRAAGARGARARHRRHVTGPLGWFVLADLLNRAGRPREAGEALARARELEGEARGRT